MGEDAAGGHRVVGTEVPGDGFGGVWSADCVNRRSTAFEAVYLLLSRVPGLDRPGIDVIVAETGADMTRFPTVGDLTSWAGVCPGNHDPADKRRRVGTTPGNHEYAET